MKAMSYTYFDVYRWCLELADTEGAISAGLDHVAIMVQVFKGSHLVDADRRLLASFSAISDGSALNTTRVAGLPGFLADIGRAIFCFGNVGLIQDLSKPKSPKFRLAEPDYLNRDKYGSRYDTIPGYTITLLRRDSRLSTDPEFGEPFLMPALAAYNEMAKARDADMRVLDKMAKGRVGMDEGAVRHSRHFQRSQALREQVIDLAGLVSSRDGIPLMKPHIRRMLADETHKLFVESVLEPYSRLIGAPRMPALVIPTASVSSRTSASP